MPKGVYERKPENLPKPRRYPDHIIELVRRLYLIEGMTVVEVQRALPSGYKAQRIIERHIPKRRSSAKRNQWGSANSSWKGADATYSAVHLRLTSQRGKASEHVCVDCDERAHDWSYQGGSPSENRCNVSGCPYSTDLSFYVPRCRRCHSAHDRLRDDMGRFAPRGGDANVR